MMFLYKSRFRRYAAALFAVGIFICIVGCNHNSARTSVYRFAQGSTWGTTYHITYNSPVELDDSIITAMKQVEMSLSPFNPASIISHVNNGEDVEIDSMIATVFNKSREINRLSGGAFDPTVAPLVNLWGFGYKNGTGDPNDAEIKDALLRVGIADCRIVDNRIVKKHQQTEFNFSAITKGFGCDIVGEMLERNGVEDYMVEIGGEMALRGKNAKGEDWHVQIDAPVESRDSIIHDQMMIVKLSGCGVATSGNYRNYHDSEKHGRVGHTINPTTGYPVTTETLAVTVIAENCMVADALATACMAMPLEDALAMIEKLPSSSALFVVASKDGDSTFQLRYSSRFPRD